MTVFLQGGMDCTQLNMPNLEGKYQLDQFAENFKKKLIAPGERVYHRKAGQKGT
jgi:hypothetical protein